MYKNYRILENEWYNKFRIKTPDGTEVVVDLLSFGGLKSYVDMIEWDSIDSIVEVPNDERIDLLLKMVSHLSKQVIGVANDQDKIFKSIAKIKWTAKKSSK